MTNFLTGRNLLLFSTVITITYIITSSMYNVIIGEPTTTGETIRALDIPHNSPITWISEGVEYTWLEPSEFPEHMNRFAYDLHARYINYLVKSDMGTLEELCEPGRVLLKYPIVNNVTGFTTVDTKTGFIINFSENNNN